MRLGRSWTGVRLSRGRGTLLFLVLIAAQMLIYDYPSILFRRPQGYHAWRQSDCLSMARNYMVTDLPPWEGQMHYLGDAGTGRVMSEMPALPYLIGHLWRHTGRHESLYRGTILLLSLIGLYALYLTSWMLLSDGLLAALVPAMLFTSPMVAYYANNFISNGAALALVLMGWYATARALRDKSDVWMLYGILLFTMAGLLKPTAALSLVALLLLFLLQRTPWRSALLGDRTYKKDRYVITGIVFGSLIIGTWYAYARAYNSGQPQGVFLIGILPYWEATPDMIDQVWQGLDFHLGHSYLRPFFYAVLGIGLVYALWKAKRVERGLWTLFVLLLVGTLCVSAIFFEALRDHDYYSLDQIILFPLALLIIWRSLDDDRGRITRSWPFQLLMIALLVHGTDFARRRVGDRYKGWMNHEYVEQLEPLGRMSDVLNGFGISANDRVICVPDISFNRSLYLLDRSGWTDFGRRMSTDPLHVRRCIDLGARFLITTTDPVLVEPGISPFVTRPIGTFENVRIFALAPGD